MSSSITNFIYQTLIYLPAVLIALTFHEYAHGKVADMLGDDTPYLQGRLTLNPLPHIDWIGFVMLVFFHFGWAKPVQVNPYRFKKVGVKKGMLLVALAGPVMNLCLAFLAMLLMRILYPFINNEWIYYLLLLLQPMVLLNLFLAIFNLIPVPPLDGSKILAGLLPDKGAQFVYSMERYSMLILIVLIATNAVSYIVTPVSYGIYDLFYNLLF